LSEQTKCPWCEKTGEPVTKTMPNDFGEVLERSCPQCGQVISAYLKGETLLDKIRERVLTFKD